MAERLRERVNSLRIDYEGEKLSISMSFGVTNMDSTNSLSTADLLKRADLALYQAKNAGRDRCCLFEENSQIDNPMKTES